jgi:beta-N-acetylhexosaminidase
VIEEIIRKRIGFGGLLLSDDLDMEALSGTVPERAAAAIAAGCDIALNCWAKMDDMRGIARQCPDMPAGALARLDKALAGTDVAAPDIAVQDALIAKRDALLALA